MTKSLYFDQEFSHNDPHIAQKFEVQTPLPIIPDRKL